MPNTRVNQSSTSAMLRRIRNPLVFISDNKYKMAVAQLLLTASQLLRFKFFNTTNLVNFSSICEANATMNRLLVSLSFLITMVGAVNISARLDDAALSERRFAKRQNENEILFDELTPLLGTRRYQHAPSFEWIQITTNEFKILAIATLLGMEYLMLNLLDPKTDMINVKFYYLMLRILATIAIAVADRFDETALTVTALTERHEENNRGVQWVYDYFEDATSAITDSLINADNEEVEEDNAMRHHRF